MFNHCKNCGSIIQSTSSGAYTCNICGNIGNVLIDNTVNDHKDKSSVLMTGWICPKCGAVMSPYQNYCINCTKIDISCTYV